jgi:outer membrane protein OmpA-like peptidoglycan-associated protein
MRITIAYLILSGLLMAQAPTAPNPVQQGVVENASGPMPIFRVNVVARTMKAINYHHRSGSTMIGFRGTLLMPDAKGEAKVESKQGVIKIDANMSKMTPATQYGPEYLTYVMWAVTPEGRATNIGEVLLSGGNSKLSATSELQSFGLIITAEPYFAVTQPSDVVVMENFVKQGTTGTIEEMDAKFELLKRGQYTLNANPKDLSTGFFDPKVPIELQEARNALRIARWAGAEQYAADTFHKAEIGLYNAEGYLEGKGGKKNIGTVAREAVQMAEDARIITVKKLEEAALASERASSAAREAKSQEEAAAEARRRTQAEVDQRMEAERRARAEAERTTAQLDATRARSEVDAARAAAQADAAMAAQERARLDASRLAAVQELERAKAEANAAQAAAKIDMERAAKERSQLEEARELAKADAEKAKMAAAESDRLKNQAEKEKEELRSQLLTQFNLILETRDSARGLIVNMSDVLFDTAQYTLRPGAREKLAKVSGIILGHPGLKLEVEGHTDSIGGDEYNQKLSEQRSQAVLDYLVKQGIASASVTSKGFGKTRPVTTNETAAGRQQNRRVELVVSGDIIGTPLTGKSH